jgi:hypothetical protein
VTLQKTGKCVCDCRLFKLSKICEHVVTAAETKGQLKKYLDWRKKKSAVNLTDLVTGGIKSGDKAKVRKPRKWGRTPVDKEPATAVHEREPLVEDSSMFATVSASDNMEKESNFELIYLFQTEAQSCYGCGTKFIRNEEQHNLIVRKYCEREYVHQEEKK